jgi:zinc transport system substrate-binding protein
MKMISVYRTPPSHRLVALVVAALMLVTACAAGTDGAVPPDDAMTNGADETPDTPPADEASEADDGAGAPADDGATAAPGAAGAGLEAVASVFPLAWLAQAVAPGADVTFLGAGGADPHDLELSPGDRALLESADVLLYMGPLSFQPQVERAADDANGEVVDVLQLVGSDAFLRWDHAHEDDDHADDDHADDDHADDDHADDDRGEYDPHLWFDAAVMADVALGIAEAFARADEAHAADYRVAAEDVRDELLALDADFDELLSACRLDTAIVSHEAYAYLLTPRGLAQEGISGAGGHGEASPQRIAELNARIRDEGIPAVLAEPVHGRSDAEALAREADVELLEVDPLEVGTDVHFERGYPALLEDQAERFATALACDGGT